MADLLKPEYQAFIRDIEKGVTGFGASTGTFMTEIIRFGPSKYDVAFVYENLAIAEKRPGTLGQSQGVLPGDHTVERPPGGNPGGILGQ